MSEQLLLINPRRRKKSHRRRAKNHRRRSRRAAGGFRIRRRRHKNPRSHRRSRRRNPIMRRRHRRHRNPISMSGIKGVLVPAAIGAAGGLALNVLWNYASPYVPTTFTSSPYLIAAVNIAIALGLGMLARKVMNANTANALVAGAITIQIYSAASFALSGTIPGLSGLGAYLPGSGMNGLGSPNPAPYLNGIGRLRRTGRVGPGTLSAYMGPGMQGLGALGGGTLGGLAMMPGGMSTDMD